MELKENAAVSPELLQAEVDRLKALTDEYAMDKELRAQVLTAN
jgi:hypothetical protein